VVTSERQPVPVLSIVLALDEVFMAFAGRPVAVARRELEAACDDHCCWLDEETLTVFAQEIAAGERVEVREAECVPPPTGPIDWSQPPF
jgi:hypothetical protein